MTPLFGRRAEFFVVTVDSENRRYECRGYVDVETLDGPEAYCLALSAICDRYGYLDAIVTLEVRSMPVSIVDKPDDYSRFEPGEEVLVYVGTDVTSQPNPVYSPWKIREFVGVGEGGPICRTEDDPEVQFPVATPYGVRRVHLKAELTPF